MEEPGGGAADTAVVEGGRCVGYVSVALGYGPGLAAVAHSCARHSVCGQAQAPAESRRRAWHLHRSHIRTVSHEARANHIAYLTLALRPG